MSHSAEQKIRTRDVQQTAMIAIIEVGDILDPSMRMEVAKRHIAEAEARGAEEQRRKDAEGYLFDNPDTGTEYLPYHPIESGECQYAENIRKATNSELLSELKAAWMGWEEDRGEKAVLTNDVASLEAALLDPAAVHQNMLRGTIAKPSWDQIKHLYPMEFAALEARIAELMEAEQLARADAEASKAREEVLEGQITALNTPQYYAVEGDDFAQDSITSIFDDCDAEHNTIIQVNGFRQVSSQWAFFDGENLHTFPTEAEAEAAHPSLTREGGV